MVYENSLGPSLPITLNEQQALHLIRQQQDQVITVSHIAPAIHGGLK